MKDDQRIKLNHISIISAFDKEFEIQFRNFFAKYLLKSKRIFYSETDKELIELRTSMSVLLKLLLKRAVTGDLIQLIYLHKRKIDNINKLDDLFSEMIQTNEQFKEEVRIVTRERLQFVFDLLEFLINSIIKRDGFIN
jgi:hypothetical protein